MRFGRLALLFVLALPLAAPAQQASLPGALYKSDSEGWQVQPPKAWKHSVQNGKLMIGSDTEAGLMLAWFQAGLTYEQAQEYAKLPYQEQGLVLTPGPAAPFATKAGKAFVVEYTGQAMDGSTIKSRSMAIAGAKGVVYVAGVTTAPQFAALSKRVDELAKGVSFFTPKVGAGAALISGPLCAWSGGSNYSSSQKMFFDGKGNVSWGSELAIGGSIKDSSGDTTATYSGYTGNANKPSDLGRYTVAGDAVNITWGDGSTMACKAHHKNGTQIVELMCGNKKLWGRGLCD
jgi:hypothetical protein